VRRLLGVAAALLLPACRDEPPPPPPPAPEVPGREAEPTPLPTSGPGAYGPCTADADCRATGCGGTLCASHDVITTCEHRPEHDCYRAPTTSCGCFEGRCSWAPTDALRECLREGR
jgi:eight-cysteine-cluster-containing protein